MAGLCGVVGSDPRGLEAPVRSMLRALVHRGPAGEGCAARTIGGDAAVIGACGDGIPGAPLGPPQPLAHPRSGDLLIFDGFLTNRSALLAHLKSQGTFPSGDSDAHVVLHALVAWGDIALDRFEGGFALAFVPADGTSLLLARDPLGIKPLYTATGSGMFLFASEVRAVLASGLVSDELDPGGVATALAYGGPQEPLTVHRAVRALRAGTSLRIAAGVGRVVERRFWRFPESVAPYDRASAAGRVQNALDNELTGMCSAEERAIVLLSDGIGSGLVAAFARYHAAAVDTFSLGFESASRADRLTEAAANARALNCRHRQTVVDDEWVAAQWDDWTRAADCPATGGLELSVLAGVVRETEVSQALIGSGAAEIFGGSGIPGIVRRLNRLARLIRRLPGAARRPSAAVLSRGLPDAFRKAFVESSEGPMRPANLAAAILRSVPATDLRSMGLLPNDIGLTPDYLPAGILDECATTEGDAFNDACRVACVVRLTSGHLRHADVYGMAQSLELRSPYAVKPLVNLALAMPGSMKAPPKAPSGFMLRKAAGAFLPYDALAHDQQNRDLPFAQWLRGAVRDQAEAAIDALCSCPLVAADPIRQRWHAWQADSTTTDAHRVLPLVAVGSYLLQRRQS